MKKLTQKQTDRLFSNLATKIYDGFITSAVVAYSQLFPESVALDDAMYDKIRERLMIELQVLYAEARSEKNVKKRFKKVKLVKPDITADYH